MARKRRWRGVSSTPRISRQIRGHIRPTRRFGHAPAPLQTRATPANLKRIHPSFFSACEPRARKGWPRAVNGAVSESSGDKFHFAPSLRGAGCSELAQIVREGGPGGRPLPFAGMSVPAATAEVRIVTRTVNCRPRHTTARCSAGDLGLILVIQET
jgi:hypothetical protein